MLWPEERMWHFLQVAIHSQHDQRTLLKLRRLEIQRCFFFIYVAISHMCCERLYDKQILFGLFLRAVRPT